MGLEPQVFLRAAAFFRQDWRWVAVLIVLIGVSVAVGLAEAWPLAVLIDSILSPQPSNDFIHRLILSVLPHGRIGQIASLVLLGLAFQLLGYLTWAARMMINYHLNYRGTTRVRHALFRCFQRVGIAYHRSRSQGDAIYRLTTDAFGPWGIVDTVIGTSVAAVTLIVMTAILLSRNGPLTAAAFTVAPFMIWSNWRFGIRIHDLALVSKQTDADLTAAAQQGIARIPLAQAFGREGKEYRLFSRAVGRSVRALLRLNWQEQLYPLARDSILAVGGAVILGYGGWLVYRDQFVLRLTEGGMTVGVLLVFMDYVRKLWDPLKWLTEFVAKVRVFEAASRRVFTILDTPEEVADRSDAIAFPLRPRTLRLSRIAFSYGRTPVLRDVSAEIAPGTMVAFIGPSGTGKSTLLSLIMRFQDPTSGSLSLDGVDYRSVRLADLRAHMALVSQDTFMLPATVAANIAYGGPGASLRDIKQAARHAGAARFIEDLPEGYRTLVAEGGQNLSGGQRQRIAIARALISGAPFLILDEPTSALDTEHERHIVDTLTALRGHRTIILVTHRLESVGACDRVFVMGDGQILEHGRPNESGTWAAHCPRLTDSERGLIRSC